MLEQTYSSTKEIYESELIEHIIIPHFSQLQTEDDQDIQLISLDFLIGILVETHSKFFPAIVEVLVNCICNPSHAGYLFIYLLICF